ncbi:hypothetical protein M569_07419 [Genlisea aurea]|uniref:alpha,alpha-trehalose-phosphate synthase (UDP-forming) n=1 Tax=Genlisea aurea TaxID=192259 RepID=S8CR93_9LAMI|nr:hypothetical protein M569_07419 [Genlisea aurea]
MTSDSYGNLLDLGPRGVMDALQTPRGLPRVMDLPGIIADGNAYVDMESESTSIRHERKIIVANMLPLHARRDDETHKWCFTLDEDSLLLQLKDVFASDIEVLYVGSLKVDVKATEQEEVAQRLFDEFKCVPTFLPPDIQHKFYHGFCKQQLWPLFHYMLPMSVAHGGRFDKQLWQAYVSANKTFADKIMEVVNPDEDFIWVHDYHLMVLPTFLRKRHNRIKLGVFLHSPFPSSEIYRTLPVRDEILRGLLNSDLVGFHTFDYARHFLSCCSRMLGLDYESKRGHMGIDYFGRTVYVKILPVGVHMGRLESVLNLSSTQDKIKELRPHFEGKILFLGVDDLDIFKGISLKLLAFENLLQLHRKSEEKPVLVQIVNPARSSGKDVEEAKKEIYTITERINKLYSCPPDYDPVILIDRHVTRYEKTAYYAVADCCIVNAVRDGMNLVPYNYIVCRQGSSSSSSVAAPRTSMLVVSEFIGCSPSLSGAIRVNPWDIDSVAEGMINAIRIPDAEKQLRHEKHYRYVSSHDVAYWAQSFTKDLERACKSHYDKRYRGYGFGLKFRVISLSPSFRKLSIEHVVSAYKKTGRRAIFLDYDGTIVPRTSILRSPAAEVIDILNSLCDDPKDTVFIISGRGRSALSDWLAPCQNLGLAAEHGYFMRLNKNSEWESLALDLDWKRIVKPVMKQYTESTDGSSMEMKESALVWHYQYADPDFGSCQAKELSDHLESVLANEPASVCRGQHIVEVKPQGVTKGVVCSKVISRREGEGGAPDFVLCIGDDRSDEDMFESIRSRFGSSGAAAQVFACTVGQKPSKAKYYLDDTAHVLRLLRLLADASNPRIPAAEDATHFKAAFDTVFRNARA